MTPQPVPKVGIVHNTELLVSFPSRWVGSLGDLQRDFVVVDLGKHPPPLTFITITKCRSELPVTTFGISEHSMSPFTSRYWTTTSTIIMSP